MDRQAIAGRFHLAAETDDAKIIGLLGGLHFHDLNEAQRAYIMAYYNLPRHPYEYLEDYPAEINRSMYTGFIKIRKTVPVLEYIGMDSWSRPVYRDQAGKLYKDTDPRGHVPPSLCSALNNEFEGEPDIPYLYAVKFASGRVCW